MKNTLINIGGILLFYLIIVFGVLLLNLRFKEINNKYVSNCEMNETY